MRIATHLNVPERLPELSLQPDVLRLTAADHGGAILLARRKGVFELRDARPTL